MPAKERPLKLSKIPRTRRQTLRSRGPASIDRRVTRYVGPGEPPPGFITPWNSAPEWIVYWALWKILHEVGDVRKPRNGVFVGGEHFGYQTVLDGGRTSLGGQIMDFVIYMPGNDIGLDLLGEQHHLAAGAAQNAIDSARLAAAARYMKVIPIYEQFIIGDPTGEQACRYLVEALGGRRVLNPVTSGTFRPTRIGRLYGGSNA